MPRLSHLEKRLLEILLKVFFSFSAQPTEKGPSLRLISTISTPALSVQSLTMTCAKILQLEVVVINCYRLMFLCLRRGT